ncbi:MAG: methyltransferase [Ardenticatenaceae bacterium]|nr:methyltransferase [Ardenticatenaceae bacterium]MCB9445376.1 methyltransferase [Ardenticatenaceae bacterium]
MKTDYSFVRYLSAKKTVDDRALNQHVWRAMAEALPERARILEIGAGIGTMVERFAKNGLLDGAVYTAVDNQPDNIITARQRLQHLNKNVHLETIDLFDFIRREQGKQTWDLLIAHAFLDLMDIPATLPPLFSLIEPGGHFYFTINFDGATIFQPTIDPILDDQIEQLYHRTMDERITDGKLSGDSRSGRHLFHQLRQAGGEILAAGSSDWVVFAETDGYPADEAYFLQFIIHTMQQALNGHPGLGTAQFADWIRQRQQQIERGDLVYIAHQIDFLGRVPK